MADFQKNKRHQRNGDQAEKGHEVNPFIRKNLPEVHAGKKHTRNNHTGRANHASDRMKRIVDQRRKPDAREKKKNSDENRNNIEVQNKSPAFTIKKLIKIIRKSCAICCARRILIIIKSTRICALWEIL